MADSETVLDALIGALTGASAYNRNDQAAPAAVLWTDREQQWKSLLPLLRVRLRLLTLGAYDPGTQSGPAYWIRCVLAERGAEPQSKLDPTPIIYLPGVSRQELRAVEDCPVALQPLAELQYRGAFWTQRNHHDWTIAAFLQNRETGLGTEMASDSATRDAAVRALVALARQPVRAVKDEAPLRAAYFDELLHPDLVSSVLLWLDDPQGFRAERSSAEWDAFSGLVNNAYGLRPERDGELVAAERLGKRTGGWDTVWRRFAMTPGAYAHVPELLRRAYPAQQPGLFDRSETWPHVTQGAGGVMPGEEGREENGGQLPLPLYGAPFTGRDSVRQCAPRRRASLRRTVTGLANRDGRCRAARHGAAPQTLPRGACALAGPGSRGNSPRWRRLYRARG